MDFFEAAYVTTGTESTPTLNDFDETKYNGEWLQISGFLKTMTPGATWTKEETNRILPPGRVYMEAPAEEG